MVTRRRFLKASALFGASLFVPGHLPELMGSRPELTGAVRPRRLSFETNPTLNPHDIPKYVDPLVIPPAMPRTTKIKQRMARNIDYYEIAVRQFPQQILPTGMPTTTVWGYGSANHPGSFNYPSFTIEAKYNRPVRVNWINDLKDANGNYLPHLLPVDPTLHWANPPGGTDGRDSRPAFPEGTPEAYTGPVPFVTHVHGAHTGQEFDGFAEAWYLPNAANIPDGYARTGTFYDYFKPLAEAKLAQQWDPGSSVFEYPNDQRATTLWYHDHVLGMTRLNVYAGPAGFYLLRGGPSDLPGGVLPGPAPALGDPAGLQYYEIPIVIQDRSFNSDGSLFFPSTRAFFDEYGGPYIPETEISPIWNPEFFGNTTVVNGKTWPKLTVEPRRYRFRLLNGCNSRFLILKLVTALKQDSVSGETVPDQEAPAALPFWQIGTEGGFLPAPVSLDTLLIGLAERADVIVDFTGLPQGTEIYMVNLGPDEPFGGGEPVTDFDLADPRTTGQVMKFVVGPLLSTDTSTSPNQIVLPALTPLGAASNTRHLSLNEMMTMPPEDEEGHVVEAMLGLVEFNESGAVVGGIPLMWDHPISETPATGDTEIWEIYNFTADAHPMHLHQVMFQVLDRQPFDGAARPPEAWESGFKDTVISFPGEITRIVARFDLPGLFVWHCHIVDHEDNEMMRPYHVGPIPPDLPHGH